MVISLPCPNHLILPFTRLKLWFLIPPELILSRAIQEKPSAVRLSYARLHIEVKNIVLTSKAVLWSKHAMTTVVILWPVLLSQRAGLLHQEYVHIIGLTAALLSKENLWVPFCRLVLLQAPTWAPANICTTNCCSRVLVMWIQTFDCREGNINHRWTMFKSELPKWLR